MNNAKGNHMASKKTNARCPNCSAEIATRLFSGVRVMRQHDYCGARCAGSGEPANITAIHHPMTKDLLQAKLHDINAQFYRGGTGEHPALDRNLLHAQVARKALEALKAKVERLEADSRAHPDSWFDDTAYLAGRLIELL